ncbi:MAG: 3-methyl-2-oxobutanoate hydroxymethyltransferase [Proteobacteria bacterium]|nr:3-methyl-2-oxobutanoate hydroxymethyltransferase [Pseudomonadota bacterium]
MSSQKRPKRLSVPEIRARKGGEKLVCLTAYTAPTARLLDPYVDLLLVGDSLGMVLYGFETTLPVTLDMMLVHGAAVVRGSAHACVVVDMPFATYQESKEIAYRNAARALAETGCAAVKLEGGRELAETIAFLVSRGIPVLGHVGLKPQSVQATGYRARGGASAEAQAILADGRAVAEAGAFAVVVEGTVEPVARRLTEELAIPTIGIGASPACDGQILVTEDILGLFAEFTPRFVKRYADLGDAVEKAVAAYAADVRAGRFPGPEHVFAGRTPSLAPAPAPDPTSLRKRA